MRTAEIKNKILEGRKLAIKRLVDKKKATPIWSFLIMAK